MNDSPAPYRCVARPLEGCVIILGLDSPRTVKQNSRLCNDGAGGGDSEGYDALAVNCDICGDGDDGSFGDAACACKGKTRGGAPEQTGQQVD